ncbi:MAG: cob(I)yrinic acid a,c-diamide adenosyltransferase [Desulfobacterales bacterium]|nr:cob(I)yrinic acid a,c-diamide adenosyltransferase [Desulfobacterales bacterium]
MHKKGLLMVNTGNGKGKTTAALGLAIRAAGQKLKVCIIQFIKGSLKYGEIEALKRFNDTIELHIMGRGFTFKSDDIEKDIKIAQNAWNFAKETILSKKHNLVILDELTYLITYKMVPEEEIIEFLKNRPSEMHIMVTGRNACESLINIADMVTSMEAVKHHYNNGINAQKGIEF